MKRRNKAVNTKNTKVQIAIANIVGGNKETRVIIFDHIKKLCFKEMVNGGMKLSFGEFETKPTKYNFIKRLLVTKFTKDEAELINNAISTAQAAELLTVEPEPQPQQMVHETIDVDSDIKREKECYDHAVKCANKVITSIESLETSGVPKEYIGSRYPDLRSNILNAAAVLNDKWSEINTVNYKKSSIVERINTLQQQLCEVNYQIYLAKEAYIVAMRDQISHLEDLDDIMAMVEEDKAEINKLNRIKELEAELAALKGESKFDDPQPQPEDRHELPKTEEKTHVELAVELATEMQDREIRYLANHFYQVRRGNEEPNPVIYRKVAELSEQAKLPKPEFCTKFLSICYTTYDRHHREFMNSLGLHIYGEKQTPPRPAVDLDEVKTRVLQWANIHLMPGDNQILNKDVYNAFLRETNMSEVTELSFYLILKRRGGYVTKNIRNYEIVDGVKKLVGKTFYIGYRLV